jgi:PAS domain-containing protein
VAEPQQNAVDAWLAPAARVWAERIAASYRHWSGTALVPSGADPATALYQHAAIVVAHDGAADPRFVYANRAAQALWGYAWQDFVGLPSRLSAPPEQRAVRNRLLDQGRSAGLVTAHDLIRITAGGRRFRIAEVQLWTLLDDAGTSIGQAATYGQWTWLD